MPIDPAIAEPALRGLAALAVCAVLVLVARLRFAGRAADDAADSGLD